MIRPRTILVVTRQPERHRELVESLAVAGYETQMADGLRGPLSPDLAVVDVDSGDFWPAVELLRGGRIVLMVTDAADMRRAFESGADDCVMADAHAEEIVARCEAVLRRTAEPERPADEQPALYADSRLWINFGLRQVWAGGKSAQLTPREHLLLRYFIQHADETLSHDQILKEVWGRTVTRNRPTEVLKQYIWRLRQKVEADPDNPEIVVTVLGEGYRFVSHFD